MWKCCSSRLLGRFPSAPMPSRRRAHEEWSLAWRTSSWQIPRRVSTQVAPRPGRLRRIGAATQLLGPKSCFPGIKSCRLLARDVPSTWDEMIRAIFDHGFSEEKWDAAKAQARQAMVAVAARRALITYSDLVDKIEACELEPHGGHLAHMLGEISTKEDKAGRGMLSVLVVHKSSDKRPGSGFFELARSLGYDTSDREAFWIRELQKVYRTWSHLTNSGTRGRGAASSGERACDYRHGR